MGKWTEQLNRALQGQAIGWVFRQAWAAVLATGAIGAALAYLEQLPLLYIFLCGLGAAGAMMWLLAQSSVRRTLSSAKDKIVVEALNPIHWGNAGRQYIRPQLAIKNLGNFPIEVDVKETGWSMDGLTGNQKTDVQTSAVVSPVGGQTLRGPLFERTLPTDSEGEPIAAPASIKVHVQVRYGKPGRMRYMHSQQYDLRCWIDPTNEQTSVSMEQIGRGRFS